MLALSILFSAIDGFSMEDTDGELGTIVEFFVHASGALSRLFECFDLLLNLLDKLDNKFLLSFSSILLAFDAACETVQLATELSTEGIRSFFN